MKQSGLTCTIREWTAARRGISSEFFLRTGWRGKFREGSWREWDREGGEWGGDTGEDEKGKEERGKE